MATSPIRPPPSDAEILEARRRSNEAVIRLLQSWENEGDPEEQRETLAYLMQALDEALGRALDEIAAMTDESDTDEVWRDVGPPWSRRWRLSVILGAKP